MTDTLTRTRQQLDMLLATIRSDVDAAAATRAAELDRREAELARAMETLSQDAAVQSAYRQGQSDEQRRVVALILMQIYHLSRNSGSRLVLSTLRRMVEGEQ